MFKCISANDKTFRSVDFTTICPKRREGKECSYCYVKHSREIGFNAKLEIDYLPYNHEILRLTKKTINKLNSLGGIRLFSFADYMSDHDNDITTFLTDCHKVGLMVKVITKQIDFIEKYHHFPAISIIHLSIDTLGQGINHEIAMMYRDRYHKVKIRSVILNDSDLDILSFADIHTFNHGFNGFTNYSQKKSHKTNLVNKYKLNEKTCCLTGKCETCPIKCLTN